MLWGTDHYQNGDLTVAQIGPKIKCPRVPQSDFCKTRFYNEQVQISYDGLTAVFDNIESLYHS